ncbi:MAG: Ca-activated chloride channel family protein [Saprospiraceae bacterium]|jgi:Ca-activated chloride channel family protein
MKQHLTTNIKSIINIQSKRKIKSFLSTFIIALFSITISFSQCTFEGKVVDAASGEAILFGTVALYKNGVLICGTETDLGGNYYFNSINPGTYDVEASYIGYTATRITGVIIKHGRTNRLNFSISEGLVLDGVEIRAYKVPLIQIGNTTSGATVTAEAIRSLPTKNINAIAATTAGIASTDGGAISIRGSRSNGTVYYVDGVRVSGLTSNNQNHHSEEVHLSNEEYSKIVENSLISPLNEPLSTFSIDVDRASYSNIRRFLNQGTLPPADAVRVEEMINYFNYDYPAPKKDKHPFKVYSELTECPWNEESKLLHIGIQGEKIETENLPASNLVFLIDVSGSMNSTNKLPLVKESFKLLVEALREDDRVAIVTYAGRAGVVLPSTSISDKAKIIKAIESLGAGGSTAGAQGIITAYDIARENFLQDGNNRVLLATDGDFNVGVSSTKELDKLIEKERRSGVFLSVLGYGMGNYKDGRMQSLANKGNGNHSYIDRIEEAKRVLVEELGGTLHTIAKDVKIQIEFNPAYVGKYRLVGYENRMLATEDFIDDTKDAGELGAGHSVTAIYEVYPPVSNEVKNKTNLKYQMGNKSVIENGELASVKLRYKAPDGHKSTEITAIVSSKTKSLDKVDDRTRHAAAIAEFGLLLRKSVYKGDASYAQVEDILSSISDNKYLTDDALSLVKTARRLDSPQ